MEDSVYNESFLQELVAGHKEQQLLAKAHFEQRKVSMMNGDGEGGSGSGGGASSSTEEFLGAESTHPIEKKAEEE
jgi:hypothetical protein